MVHCYNCSLAVEPRSPSSCPRGVLFGLVCCSPTRRRSVPGWRDWRLRVRGVRLSRRWCTTREGHRFLRRRPSVRDRRWCLLSSPSAAARQSFLALLRRPFPLPPGSQPRPPPSRYAATNAAALAAARGVRLRVAFSPRLLPAILGCHPGGATLFAGLPALRASGASAAVRLSSTRRPAGPRPTASRSCCTPPAPSTSRQPLCPGAAARSSRPAPSSCPPRHPPLNQGRRWGLVAPGSRSGQSKRSASAVGLDMCFYS